VDEETPEHRGRQTGCERREFTLGACAAVRLMPFSLMSFLRGPVALRSGLMVGLLGLAGCVTPAYRDFAEVSAPAATDSQNAELKTRNPKSPPLRLLSEVVPSPADLGPILAQIGERHDIPALGAVVLRGDQIVAEGIAGVRRRGTATPVTIDDRFQIASCAKAMSAQLVARLVEEGVLDWDRPITAYFSEARFHPDWNKVTLRNLINHTAGVRDPLITFLRSTAFDRGTLSERRRAFAEKVLRSKPAAPTGDRVVYCNTDYILAAVVAEKVTGKPWEQLMHSRVFAPLGLDSAGFGPPGSPGQTREPWGHGKHRLLQIGVFGKSAFDPAARGADYPAIASPAGYIHLSIRDWAEFVSLQLRAHPANPHSRPVLLRPGTFAVLHGTESTLSYAGGWNVGTRPWAKGSRAGDSGRLLFHLGDNGRWTSAVWVAPEKDFAVMVACNRGDQGKAVDEVVGRLISTYARR
jgi:D-alanyl-D-alanine carboxypeptidase